ncbi:MAG TPA: hypothetical protein VJ930_07800 [Acidimicrobiia bacterium]|jgi:hypothetical protein|nr:hypothetical protein [Acidimicrobiia bacterium]
MIPTAILLGLFGGLIPRYRWWSIPVIGIIWSIILTTTGDPTASIAQIWIGGFFLGAVNGAVGVAWTWLVWKLILFVSGLVRRSGSRKQDLTDNAR